MSALMLASVSNAMIKTFMGQLVFTHEQAAASSICIERIVS